jgi:hypothetical protein
VEDSLKRTPEATNKNVLLKEWIVGFTEGDGSFFVSNRGVLSFSITQKEEAILQRIKAYFQFGGVYRGKTSFEYQVRAKDAIFSLITFFNGFIQIPKVQVRFSL